MRCLRAVKALRALESSELVCIALYTEPDRSSPFVRHADIALALPSRPGSAVQSYLDHDTLLATLREARADAVWPGWGFVAEDAAFVDRLDEAGIRFLGPSGDVMRSVGDKIASKRVAEKCGVPVAPWSGGELADVDDAARHAERIGYPIVIKASAGGGGRGIRVVDDATGLAAAFESARAEARSAFGDDRLFLEERLRRGRHIEVQIAADHHGHTMAVGCRDCSVQRRHQKVLEEAPPPGLAPERLAALEGHAVRLAREVGYRGVGTVEFLVAGDAIAFLEVNPRLQVEHGITEEITGLDLVGLQIRIARGERLPALPPPGPVAHAIEARICAEDPEADFLPAPGRITRFDPALGPHLRIDTGVTAGAIVPPDFDSLIAKVIATGATREEARARLASALVDFELLVEGGASNKGYLIDLLDHANFREARVDTEWLDRDTSLRAGSREFEREALAAAAILSYQQARDAARGGFLADPSHIAPGSIPASDGQRVDLTRGGQGYRLEVFAVGAWRYRVHLEGRVVQASLRSEGPGRSLLRIGGCALRVVYDITETGLRVEVEGRPYRFGSELAGQVRAGTPAMVVALAVEVGDRVSTGQSLGRLEAMKMEIGLESPVTGTVKEVWVRSGQQVPSGAMLLAIEPDADTAPSDAGPLIEFPDEVDALDLFYTRGADDRLVPDLAAPMEASHAARGAAIDVAREEIRRVLMGYDVNEERAGKLAEFLEAPVPDALDEDWRAELALVRHELTLFADITGVTSRAPVQVASGPGPSHYAQLRDFVRRLDHGDAVLTSEFAQTLERALAHYGVTKLEPGDACERAVLRLLASQLAPALRRRLVRGCLQLVQALAASGIHLSDDLALDDALARIASLRPLVSDAIADLALEARYSIFEGPRLQGEAERTSKEVEAWLAAAESAVAEPPAAVLAHLASAPRAVFDRVGGWTEAPEPRRRAVALAAHLRRLYAPGRPASHTSGVVGEIHVERLDFADGRIVLGSVARRSDLGPALERLGRAAAAAAVRNDPRRVHALELFVPVSSFDETDAVCEAAAPLLSAPLAAERVTLNLLTPDGRLQHESFAQSGSRLARVRGLYGLHPVTADRIQLDRLAHFDLERLEAPEDLYAFHLTAPDADGDERIFVLADVRGRSPDEAPGHEASLHVPGFERDFFEAARCLRNHLTASDPRRRLQWNRLMLFASPTIYLDAELVETLARRLAPATRNLGLEKVVVRLNVLDRDEPEQPARAVEIVIADPTGSRMELSWRAPHRDRLTPARFYERKVVEARRRRLVYPYEIVRMLTDGGGDLDMGGVELPPGHFIEYDLDPRSATPLAMPVDEREYGQNTSAIVFGVIDTPTESLPEGMRRVLVLSDPTVGMGSLAGPECDRLVAALDLAEALRLPVEWIPVSSGAKIAMDSGTENLDATARVVRRIVHFTQDGGVIHLIIPGVNVGAQSYFDALSTMLQHTRGALIMTPGASMVLTGRAALEASGSVSAEDETAIGGFERVMGPNGEAQYYARNLVEAYGILYAHYRYSYVVPGESGPRPLATVDPVLRDVTQTPTETEEGHDFASVGGIFDADENGERKRPFAMRALMDAVIDEDHTPLERWRHWRGAETAIVWDAALGGHAVTLVGIESRNVTRGGEHPADGPASFTGGTLFPLSSKKVARAINAASGNRPVVLLANLSGFDGSPESMRKLQLEYGAEIARAVVNFDGPIAFLVVSRYHGGAYVVFSQELNPGLRAAAVEGSFASVIGGGPAAAVVFAREASARALREPALVELRRDAARRGTAEARAEFDAAFQQALLEKQAELAAEFDAIHTVERAREVGSLERVITPDAIRPYLIDVLGGPGL
jgi:acetyl/propionyl-CoA carboxylase alpha subunit/acetyl-CoA carboxylase carboxyltransferase component